MAYGYGVKKDYNKAKEYFEKSAELGNSIALNNLGDLYENGNYNEKYYNYFYLLFYLSRNGIVIHKNLYLTNYFRQLLPNNYPSFENFLSEY